MAKVAIVTGSNKGIGLAIVRGLCKQFKGDVYITSRKEVDGTEAVELLQKEGLAPKYHQLDVTDRKSVEKLRDHVVKEYGGIDVLVNNAGIASKRDDPTPFIDQVETTLKTNFNGVINVCDVMFPSLRPGARVVHVSSTVSIMYLKRCTDDRKKIITDTNMEAETVALIDEFVTSVKDGSFKDKGWAEWAYGVSKLGVSLLTPAQQSRLDGERPGDDIVVNCCCPGMVNTDMVHHKGGLTPDEGALTPIYLALLPPGEQTVKGAFVYQKQVYNWKHGDYPSFLK